jgi:hypothetical protein
MAANSNYQDEGKKTPAKQAILMNICPSCGKTVDLSRRYCNCHADIRQAATTASYNRPDIGPCNFESPGLTCNDCPEDCMYCSSFGEPKINSAGYGGKDCRHKITGTAKCYCCQAQVGVAIKLDPVNFLKLAREVLQKRREEGKAEEGKNVFLQAADVIREEMEKPILARINQYRERAG